MIPAFITLWLALTSGMFGFICLMCAAFKDTDLSESIDQLWQRVAADKPKGTTTMPPTTEAGKVAEIASAYDALKSAAVTANAQIAAQSAEIASLTAQINNGTPVTADQLAALTAVDQLDLEVEADQAAAAPSTPASPAPAPTPTDPSAPAPTTDPSTPSGS